MSEPPDSSSGQQPKDAPKNPPLPRPPARGRPHPRTSPLPGLPPKLQGGTSTGPPGSTGPVTQPTVRPALRPVKTPARSMERSGSPPRTVVRVQMTVSSDEPMPRLTDAIAATGAEMADRKVFGPQGFRWRIQDAPNLVADADGLDQCQTWLTGLVRETIDRAGRETGITAATSPLLISVGADLIIDPIADLEEKASLTLDIAGIAIGIMTANHLLVVGSIKDLARKEFDRAVSDKVKAVLDRLLVSKEQPLDIQQAPASPDQLGRGKPSPPPGNAPSAPGP